MVTTYIEQLSMIGLVEDPAPMFGTGGGMWIGYQLTDKARELAGSESDLRRAVADLIGGPRTEVSEAIALLHDECKATSLNVAYRENFLQTLAEIRVCFDDECYLATIGLCGKVLEVCLKEILARHEVEVDPNAMIGILIRSVRKRIPDEYIDPSLDSVASIINASRIGAVHAKENIPVPSRDQAIMVLFATRDVVRRNLTHSV